MRYELFWWAVGAGALLVAAGLGTENPDRISTEGEAYFLQIGGFDGLERLGANLSGGAEAAMGRPVAGGEDEPALAEARSWVLLDGAAENRRLVEAVIERTVAQAEAAHAALQQAMSIPQTWEPVRARLQQRFRAAVGLDPWPERTPLRAQLLGETLKDGYKVQRLTFESRPGFVVTANVYVPTPPNGRKRFPAVLCPVGHWPYAKAQPQVQARCIGLAKLGFISLTYDPFGQGERAVEGNGHSEYFRTLLAGRNNMSYMLWDTMRALDYLLTREDVDPDRIGCTGASGGGLNTLYVSALDERIAVAVPVVYVTAFAEFLRTQADHCPCSHIPGLARFADMGDIAALIAPRPMLWMTARKDPQFTVAGARHAEAEARPAYRAYGRETHLEVREFDSDHDYNQQMREALYGFLLKHLQGIGDGSPVPEPEMALEPPDSPALRCFPDGRVPATAATVRALARQEALALRAALPAPEVTSREALATLLNWPAEPIAPAVPEPLPAREGPEGSEKLLLRTADGIALPALFFRRRMENGDWKLENGDWRLESRELQPHFLFPNFHSPLSILHSLFSILYSPPAGMGLVVAFGPEGKHVLALSPPIAALREEGWDLLLVDLRGWGETAGREHLLATDSLFLGEPLALQRARDALAVVAYLRTQEKVSSPIVLWGQGVSGGLVALLAGALASSYSPLSNFHSPFSNLQVSVPDLPASLLDLYDAGVPADAAIWELLKAADIPHLQALAGEQGREKDET